MNAPAAVSAREAANMLTEMKKMDQQILKPHKQGNEDLQWPRQKVRAKNLTW